MQTNNPVADAADDPQYTEFQRMMAKAYGVHPKFAPAQAAELTDASINPTGYRRRGVQPIRQVLTPEQQAIDLAGKYGVNPRYWPAGLLEDEPEAATVEPAETTEETLDQRAARLFAAYDKALAALTPEQRAELS